jgi:multidrug efflux pump subunit AcrA (membrane-fusion protein)
MIGLIPIPAESSNHDSQTTSVHRAVMAFEQFQEVTDVPGWQSRAERLARRCEPLLLASLERESIPFLATLQKWRHAPARGWHRRLLPALLLMTLLACILTFVPSEFTVTGTAELVPDHRREVFASGSGIVEQLLVQHGDDVEVDQPLVVLRDPQLDLELPKIMGEIEVVRERLKGVLAIRLVGSTGADAANRARQLTSEEEELKERQQSLIRQRRLIEQIRFDQLATHRRMGHGILVARRTEDLDDGMLGGEVLAQITTRAAVRAGNQDMLDRFCAIFTEIRAVH